MILYKQQQPLLLRRSKDGQLCCILAIYYHLKDTATQFWIELSFAFIEQQNTTRLKLIEDEHRRFIRQWKKE